MIDAWMILIALIAFLSIYLWISLTKFVNTEVPYNPPWPIVGNMGPVVFKKMHLNELMKKYYDRWPNAKYVGFYNFCNPGVIIRDLDILKSLAVKNFETFSNHKTFVNEGTDPMFGKSLFFLQDAKWRKVRHLLSPAFTASKMRLMFELISNCAINFTDYLIKDVQNGVLEFEMKDAFTRYTNDVIATCAFGISVNSMKDKNNDFYTLGKIATSFSGSQIAKILLINFFPNLAKLMKVRVFDDKVMKYFQNVIQNTIETRIKEGIVRPDMLQLMIESMDKPKHCDMNIEDMTAQAFIFFFGGFETSSSLMSFAATALAINSEVQNKLYDEIETVLKDNDGNPTYEIISEMPYLNAVLCEALRLYSISGFVDRLCNRDFELPPALPNGKPFKVTPGMSVWFPIIGIHMDPKYYAEPERFYPERFLDKKSQNQNTYLPFGVGPRMCIGNRFALLENKIVLLYLLSKFRLTPSKKLQLPLALDKTTFNVIAEGGFWLKLLQRKN